MDETETPPESPPELSGPVEATTERGERPLIGAAALVVALCAIVTTCVVQELGPDDGRTDQRDGDEIVVAGQLFDIGTRVVLWSDPGGYDAYDESTSILRDGSEGPTGKRYGARKGLRDDSLEALRDQVDQFVLHYDVAVVSRRCFDVLQRRRGLSVHFMLDADGTIYQTLDLRERAWHATVANDRAVGVEIAHIGAYSAPGHPEIRKVYKQDDRGTFLYLPAWIGESGFRTEGYVGRPDREGMQSGTVQGRDLYQIDYTPEQYEALAHLCAGLHRALQVPLEAPRDGSGALITSALSAEDLASFDGVIGHFHVQTNKVDPGPAFQWERVLARARELLDD